MSLDVSISFKKTKTIKMSRVACGSTIPVCNEDDMYEAEEWSANITHNMGEMASHVPINVGSRRGTLYDYVWRPEEQTPPLETTDELLPILNQGISYMVARRKDLLQYDPSNGWGDYDSFLMWLIQYKEACEDYPGCKIKVWR